MIFRTFILSLFLFVVSCSPRQVACPVPELVKLQKSDVRLARVARQAGREDVLRETTTRIDYFQKPEVEPKALKTLEIWDCPRPGLKHDKMMARKSAQLQKRYDKYLKKVARYTAEHTMLVKENPENQ